MTTSISRVGILVGAVLGITLSLAADGAPKQTKNWPMITLQNHNYIFDGRSSYASAGITIFSAEDGRALYNLACHNAKSGGAAHYGGLIECQLFSVDDDTTDLFRAPSDTVRRARFFSGHVRPGCRKYKYWGSVRNFDLRGMRLVVKVHDYTPPRGTKGARFQVDIETEDRPGATGAFAPPAPVKPPWWFVHPRAACSQIVAPAK